MNITQKDSLPETENRGIKPFAFARKNPFRGRGHVPSPTSNRINKKIITAGIIAALVLIVGIGLFVYQQQKPEPIVIGAVFPMTGPSSLLWERKVNGLHLAIEEINARGGMNGRQIELVIEDSQSTAEGGREAFLKIEAEHHPLFYVETGSALGRAIAPLAEEAEVVLIASATDPKVIEGRKWVFKNFPSPKNELPPILSIVDELEPESVGILYLDDAFGRSIYEPLAATLRERGKQVQGVSFVTEDFDFTEEIKELENTDMIIGVAFLGHFGEIFKEIRRVEYPGSIVASSDAAHSTMIELFAANGVYIAASNVWRSDYIFVQELEEKYNAIYNDNLFDPKFANAYEALYILNDLIGDQEITRDSVRQVFDGGFTYSGVFGVITVSAGDHDFGYPLFPARIVDGELEYLQ